MSTGNTEYSLRQWQWLWLCETITPVRMEFSIGFQKPAGPSERQKHLSYVFLGFVSKKKKMFLFLSE